MVTQQANSPLKNRTVWIAFGVLLLVGAGAVGVVRNRLQARQAAIEEAAAPLPQRVSVAALGRIEPEDSVIDIAASENGLISQLLVTEGEQVQQGQILAYLDMYDVRKAERDYAEGQLIEARRRLAAENQLGTSQVQEAITRIDLADAPKTQAIAAQNATMASLEAQLNLAKLDLDRFQDLFNQGAISRQELDRQQTEVNRLQADLASAEATKAQLIADQSADLENASAQVVSAEANLELSRVQSGVTSADRNLALAEARLALSVVKAPIAGQILDIYVDPGESVANQRLLSLGNTNEMYVVAEVYETDVGLVEVGQPVTITSRNGAFEQTITGQVEEIGLQIFKNDVLDDDPAANADARVVEVRIAIDQDEVVKQLTNLQVDVLIEVES